jgi:hypothetical protein
MIGYVIAGVLAVAGYVYYEHHQATATPRPPALPKVTPAAATPPPQTGPVAQVAQQAAAQAQAGNAPLLVLPTGQGTGVLDPMSAAAAASAAAQAQAAQAAAAAASAASRVLSDPTSTARERSAAASALTQAPPKKK